MLGTWSATHPMYGEEGDVAVVCQAGDEGERECSFSEKFLNACYLSIYSLSLLQKDLNIISLEIFSLRDLGTSSLLCSCLGAA